MTENTRITYACSGRLNNSYEKRIRKRRKLETEMSDSDFEYIGAGSSKIDYSNQLENEYLQLLDLPLEIIVHIMDYMKATDIFHFVNAIFPKIYRKWVIFHERGRVLPYESRKTGCIILDSLIRKQAEYSKRCETLSKLFISPKVPSCLYSIRDSNMRLKTIVLEYKTEDWSKRKKIQTNQNRKRKWPNVIIPTTLAQQSNPKRFPKDIMCKIPISGQYYMNFFGKARHTGASLVACKMEIMVDGEKMLIEEFPIAFEMENRIQPIVIVFVPDTLYKREAMKWINSEGFSIRMSIPSYVSDPNKTPGVIVFIYKRKILDIQLILPHGIDKERRIPTLVFYSSELSAGTQYEKKDVFMHDNDCTPEMYEKTKIMNQMKRNMHKKRSIK